MICKASGAAKGICQWVHALSAYAKVAHSIAPKREALKRAEAELLQATRAQQVQLGACDSVENAVDADSTINLEELQHIKEQKARNLEEALHSMEDLDQKSIQELKALSKPPKDVDVVCASVGVLIGFGKDCSWKDAQKMMLNPRAFCDTLKAFDAKRIPDATLKRCEAFTSQPCFNYEVMKKKSNAAADLCLWVLKVVAFRKAWGEAKRTMESEQQEQQSHTTNSDAVVKE